MLLTVSSDANSASYTKLQLNVTAFGRSFVRFRWFDFVCSISFVRFRSFDFVRSISIVRFRSFDFVRSISFVRFRSFEFRSFDFVRSISFVRFRSFDFVRLISIVPFRSSRPGGNVLLPHFSRHVLYRWLYSLWKSVMYICAIVAFFAPCPL